MSETEPIRLAPRVPKAPDALQPTPPTAPNVSFDRRELDRLLGLYGRMVAAGEWRDYAMDFGREHAAFSVFRHASEAPLYRIEKTPALARRQGQYAVVSTTGLILKRGHELASVLAVLEKKAIKLVTA